jgi:hypothetical protein
MMFHVSTQHIARHHILQLVTFQGGYFPFFLLELWLDRGVDNLVSLVLLLIYPDVCMPDNPLFFLVLLRCIEVSKINLLLCGDIFVGVWSS